MRKKITCIECPKGCQLEVDLDDGGHVIKVTGNQCPKGEVYARQELENPTRVLTTTVLAEGLNLKLVPVRTSQAIPKSKLLEAMAESRKVKLTKPVKVGATIIANLLGLGVDLVATRNAGKL
jgi:CxxC motif-containing protein